MEELKELLDREATRINSGSFIEADPVQFPRRFEKLQDIEIVSLLAATIAWGNRTMICRDAEKLLLLMEHDPYNYVMDEGYEDLDDSLNIHRTFFARNLKYYLRGLRLLYSRFGSLDEFSASVDAAHDDMPAWKLVEALGGVLKEANPGVSDNRCLPGNLAQTALKRINMALRWLVRDDGIVDMGVWKSIPKSKLYIPLDVHVGNVARELGILQRKANDRKSVVELTSRLREYRPEDPVFYDYALFGLGVEAKQKH